MFAARMRNLFNAITRANFGGLVKDFFKRHVTTWWALCGTVIAFIVGLFKIYSPLNEWSKQWLNKQVVSLNPNGYKISDAAPTEVAWFLVSLAFLLLALVYLVWFLWRSEKVAEQSDRKSSSLEVTFKETMKTAGLIVEKISSTPMRTLKSVLDFHQTYTLYDNGDCYISETSLITSKEHDLHLMMKSIEPESVADPAHFPSDINLRIESGTPGKEVAYLISRNEPRDKRFVIFFLPAMQRGGNDQRETTVSFYWEGYLKKLVTEGEEEISYSVKSLDPVPTVEYVFWAKPKSGQLTCSNIGGYLTEEPEFEKLEDKATGMKGIAFRAKNVPGDYTVKLLLKINP